MHHQLLMHYCHLQSKSEVQLTSNCACSSKARANYIFRSPSALSVDNIFGVKIQNKHQVYLAFVTNKRYLRCTMTSSLHVCL